jgi:hypothetical protein
MLVVGCADDAVPTSVGNETDSGRSIGTDPMQPDSMVMVVDEQDPDTGVSVSECREGERRGCEDSCGADLCVDGEFQGVCESASELCNGVDDDCDEAVDEDYEANGLGFSCQIIQENGCTANGTNVCSESGTSVTCEAQPVMPGDEICDGQDNDCDSAVDEDFPGSVCCVETYQCPIGNVCTDGLCTKDDDVINPGGSGGNAECDASSDCPFGQYCESGSCVSAGGICISDSDCAAGYRCDDFICIPGTGGSACTYDFECDSDEVCEDGRCTSDDDFCFVDADCPSGFECQTLICVPEGSTPGGGTDVNFCTEVETLSGDSAVEGSTQGRSDSYRPSCAYGSSEAPDLIYQWQPTRSGTYTLDTNGSSFDTILAILDDCGTLGVELDCDDDDGDSTRSSITIEANAFQTYYVVISGYFSTASGNTVLNIVSDAVMMPDCTLDSDCSGAEICRSGRCELGAGAGFCGSTSSITTGIEVTGTTSTASDLAQPSCGQSSSVSPDRIHRWTPTRTASYTLTTDGSSFDTVLAVYPDCDGVPDIHCDDDGGAGSQSSITLDAQAFESYYVLVSGYKTDAKGNYSLNVSEGGMTSPECTSSAQCAANQRCENERCVLEPTETSPLCDRFRDDSLIEANYPINETYSLTTNSLSNCDDNDGPDYDIRWYPIQSGTYSIRVESNTGAALVLGIYEGCNDFTGALVSCVDDWFSLNYEEAEITVDVDAIDEYEIVVSGQDSDDLGEFTLTIEQN